MPSRFQFRGVLRSIFCLYQNRFHLIVCLDFPVDKNSSPGSTFHPERTPTQSTMESETPCRECCLDDICEAFTLNRRSGICYCGHDASKHGFPFDPTLTCERDGVATYVPPSSYRVSSPSILLPFLNRIRLEPTRMRSTARSRRVTFLTGGTIAPRRLAFPLLLRAPLRCPRILSQRHGRSLPFMRCMRFPNPLLAWFRRPLFLRLCLKGLDLFTPVLFRGTMPFGASRSREGYKHPHLALLGLQMLLGPPALLGLRYHLPLPLWLLS